MPAAGSQDDSCSVLNCGLARDAGILRTSATSPIAAEASVSSTVSGGQVQWPIVHSSPGRVVGSATQTRDPLDGVGVGGDHVAEVDRCR